MLKLEPPVVGWGAVVGAVVGYDAWALATGKPTLSAAFYQACRQPRLGWCVRGLWLALTWHLMFGDHRLLPPTYHARYAHLHPLWAAHGWADGRRFEPPVVAVVVDEVVDN